MRIAHFFRSYALEDVGIDWTSPTEFRDLISNHLITKLYIKSIKTQNK